MKGEVLWRGKFFSSTIKSCLFACLQFTGCPQHPVMLLRLSWTHAGEGVALWANEWQTFLLLLYHPSHSSCVSFSFATVGFRLSSERHVYHRTLTSYFWECTKPVSRVAVNMPEISVESYGSLTWGDESQNLNSAPTTWAVESPTKRDRRFSDDQRHSPVGRRKRHPTASIIPFSRNFIPTLKSVPKLGRLGEGTKWVSVATGNHGSHQKPHNGSSIFPVHHSSSPQNLHPCGDQLSPWEQLLEKPHLPSTMACGGSLRLEENLGHQGRHNDLSKPSSFFYRCKTEKVGPGGH